MRKNTNNDPRKTQAKRIGSRIREIRTMRGMSQDEFGQLVGLSADRVQQYENGFRTPKPELLKNLAAALKCSPLALADPVISSPVGVMFSLFEMEKYFDLQVTYIDGKLALWFGDGNTGVLNCYVREWESARRLFEEQTRLTGSDVRRKNVLDAYNGWKCMFPYGHADEQLKALQVRKMEETIDFLTHKLKTMIESSGKQENVESALSTRLM